MKFFIFFIFFLFFSFQSKAIDTKAEEAIIIDFNTNEVLFEKNADLKIEPASLTKIMTTYVVFDRLKNTNLTLENLCRVSPKAYKMGGSRMFIEIDDKINIKDLLRGIIIQSGNDSSVAISECLAGTEKDFAKLMNVYAKKIGMLNTNFTNSSGWPNENHYSTVRDIAILSNSIIKDFPKLYSYFKEKNFKYNEIKQPNRNRLLSNYEGADGLKTGFLKSSGWAIAGSALREKRRITVVLSGTNSSRARLIESSNLLDWAFNQTSEVKLFKKNQIIKNVDVWLGSKPTVNMIVDQDIISILSYDQIKTMESFIEYEKPISAPIKSDTQIGSLIIKISGKPDMTIPLFPERKIDNINPLFKIFAVIKYLIFGTSLDGE